ncbi:Putative serine/threonine-protein kinase nek3 [Durusdinium trenchii]|uniref:Serine/threonine-protein kinase nek3 n=1 Tax=Durusdinium trenchii TaxID=1381693 RepID=A0ABP0LUU7_9DINO
MSMRSAALLLFASAGRRGFALDFLGPVDGRPRNAQRHRERRRRSRAARCSTRAVGRGVTAVRGDLVLNLGLELQSLGYEVHVESAEDFPELDALKEFLPCRLNGQLKTLLDDGRSGDGPSLFPSLGTEGSSRWILCFSSRWSRFFATPSFRSSGVRWMWYVYQAPADRGQKQDMGAAMANADKVLFLREADREVWSRRAPVAPRGRGATGRVTTFRAFLRSVDLPRSSREDVRQQMGLKQDFVMTIMAAESCSTQLDVDTAGRLAAILQEKEKFASSWLVAIFGANPDQHGTKIHENILLLTDYAELLKYLSAADVHVSFAAWAQRDVLLAKALDVPVFSDARDDLAAAAPSVDFFALDDTTWPSLLSALAEHDPALSHRAAVGRAGGQLARSRGFFGELVRTRVQQLVDFLEESDPDPDREESGRLRVGVLAQLHDPSRWDQLWPCIRAVLEAAGKKTVNVLLTTTQPLEALKEPLAQVRANTSGAAAFASLRWSVLSRAENRGADIGIFLQQLLLARELSLESDVIFKLHTKKRKAWRDLMIEPLCGSVQVVQSILQQFESDRMLGMMGPTNLTWRKEGPTEHVAFDLAKFGFDPDALREMNFVWSLLKPPGQAGNELPPAAAWTIIAGSFYWIRAGLTWEEQILPMIPRLLDTMGPYHTGCHASGCSAALGLERLIPTLVALERRVAAAPAVPAVWASLASPPAAARRKEEKERTGSGGDDPGHRCLGPNDPEKSVKNTFLDFREQDAVMGERESVTFSRGISWSPGDTPLLPAADTPNTGKAQVTEGLHATPDAAIAVQKHKKHNAKCNPCVYLDAARHMALQSLAAEDPYVRLLITGRLDAEPLGR